MKNSLVLFFLISSNLIFSQTISSVKENNIWLEKLETISSKKEKIKFIIERIKLDSIYKNEAAANFAENGNIYNKYGSAIACKIIFGLSKKKKSILLDLNENPNYSSILKYLNDQTIDEIKILRDLSATALFGIKGNCGVVYLIASDKAKKLGLNF